MSIKEKPLINAVARLGALPGFLFANSFTAGFFCILISPLFGATIAVFQAAGGAATAALTYYVAAVWGGVVSTAIAMLIVAGIGVSAIFNSDERAECGQFVVGAVVGFIVLAVCFVLFKDNLYDFFDKAEPIMCGGPRARCG